jgi:hypothetical protein
MLQGNTGGDDLFLNSNDAPTLNSVIWGSTTVRALTSGGLAPITAWTVAITGNVTGNLTGSVGSVAAGGIASTSFATGAITADSIAADATNEIADALLARNVSGGSSTGRTVKQALHVLRNKVAISAGTMTVYDTDDASSSWTAAVTGTAGADPVTTVDPA